MTKKSLHRLLASVGLIAGLSIVGFVLRESTDVVLQPAFLSPPEGTPGTAHSFDELVSGSDSIVLGTVLESRSGRTVGDDDAPLQFEETVVTVESVIAGADIPTSVVVESVPERLYDVDWRARGEQVLLFLWLKRDAESGGEYHRLLVPDAAYLIKQDRLVHTGSVSEIASELAGTHVSDAEVRIRAMREELAAGG